MEVIIPAGSSPGAITVRAIVSDAKSKAAPSIMLSGINVFPFAPESFLTICGAINPTKPIVPPAHTAQLTASAPEIRTKIRSRSTSTPSVEAVFSPQVSKSSGRATAKAIIIERAAGIAIKTSSYQPRPLKLPKIQV